MGATDELQSTTFGDSLMAATKRKFMAVTMIPELYVKAQEAAAKRDIPVTAWVREVVIAELNRNP